MTLAPGSRLGTYEIVGSIGGGGMGEVFRAKDTKLDRNVAIKVLPSHLAADEAARARFEREAKAVAALSHPNILAIHDFGVQDGIAYAVMELLAGETLRARLASGPLPQRKVTQIAADIAHGLAAAHDKGIVHRDLKPENVFIGEDGRVKILDFGLARQLGPSLTGSGDVSESPTVERHTDAGTVMGTVGYMSPEQVKGQAADHRADVFSLGCVLYEMACGRRAFARETAAETMTAILREDPPPLPPDSAVGGALDAVVHHCLEKRPEERFQSARDLAFALQSLSGSTTSGRVAVPVGLPTRRRPLLPIALAFAAVASLWAIRYARRQAGAGSGGSPGPQVVSYAQLTDLPGVETAPSLSPDGKSVVYVRAGAAGGIFLQRVGARNATRLTPDFETDVEPQFSPDGERIAFRSERDGGGIFLMGLSGESVTRVTDFGYSPSWSPDGTEIVVSPSGFAIPTDLNAGLKGLTVVSVKSGRRRELMTDGRAMQPSWSPSGARIAFWGVRGASGQRDIWTIAADGTDAASGGVSVTDDAALDWSPTWSPDGSYLYFSSTRGGTMNLWRVGIDEASGRVRGEPDPVTTPSTWSGFLSFARDGTRLAFASLDYRSTLFRAPFDAARAIVTGPPTPIVAGTRPIRDHELSPDGEWIAFTEAGGHEDLFVARVDGSQYRRLTDDPFRDRGPAWSPDGTRIAFYSDRGGAYDAWTIRPDGSGLVQLTEGSGIPGFPVWAPDGKRIAAGFDIWHVLNATATRAKNLPPARAIDAALRFLPTSWSPDGARIAGMTLNAGAGKAGLSVYTLATNQHAQVPGELARGSFWLFPVWLADGKRLIVRRPEGIAVLDAGTGAGKLLIRVAGYMFGKGVGVSHDNRWITYTETATEGDVWIATLRKQGS